MAISGLLSLVLPDDPACQPMVLGVCGDVPATDGTGVVVVDLGHGIFPQHLVRVVVEH